MVQLKRCFLGVSILFLAASGRAGEPALLHEVFAKPLDLHQPSAGFVEVSQQLQKVSLLRADFREEKKLKALQRPMKSSGKFLVASEHGLFWQTQIPRDRVFVITPKGISQLSEGNQTVSVKTEDQPIIHSFTEMFMAMFTGDTSVLQSKFHLYFTGDAAQWTLGLVPKGRMMSKMIHHIVLQGGETLEEVDIVETGGDMTHIDFSNVQVNGPSLKPEESAYFDL